MARGMAKLHRKIRLLECARGGVFGGVAEGGGKSWFWGILGIQGCWGCCGLPQEVASKLDSVKTDLIAVERNLVSGNKLKENKNHKQKNKSRIK